MSHLSREELLRLAAMLLQAAAEQRASEPVQTAPQPLSLPPQYVTLDQAAAWVSRSKRTLEDYRGHRRHPLPDPAIEGGGGRPHLWEWGVIRLWLQETFRVSLPEQLPKI